MRQWVSGDEDREVSTCSEQEVGESFDELARSLAEGTMPRRRALRLFGAALLGSVMASIPGIAWAVPCKPGHFQCGRRCCEETFSCVRGNCVCPTGTEFCEGGTLQGTDTCCPEGYFCCKADGPEGIIVASICCPRETSVCNRSSDNLVSCVPV